MLSLDHRPGSEADVNNCGLVGSNRSDIVRKSLMAPNHLSNIVIFWFLQACECYKTLRIIAKLESHLQVQSIKLTCLCCHFTTFRGAWSTFKPSVISAWQARVRVQPFIWPLTSSRNRLWKPITPLSLSSILPDNPSTEPHNSGYSGDSFNFPFALDTAWVYYLQRM